MSEPTTPAAKVLQLVEQQYRDNKDVSKEEREHIAAVLTSSLGDAQIRNSIRAIEELNKARDDLKEKYSKDGMKVHTHFIGGDLGQLTKITLKTSDKSTELSSGAEFDAFKRIYDKRAALVKGMYFDVLKLAAKSDVSAKVALKASDILYGMTSDQGESERSILESFEKKAKESDMQMNHGMNQSMQRAVTEFRETFGHSAGASPGGLATRNSQQTHRGPRATI